MKPWNKAWRVALVIGAGVGLTACSKDRTSNGNPGPGSRSTSYPGQTGQEVHPTASSTDPSVGTDSRGMPSGPSGGTTGGGAGSGTSETGGTHVDRGTADTSGGGEK